jgi:HEAT repeat protein
MTTPAPPPLLVAQIAEDLSSPLEEVRHSAVRSALGEPTVPIGLFLRALDDISPRVRREAFHALTTNPSTAAVLAALGDTVSLAATERLRSTAAEALLSFGELARPTIELVLTHGTTEGRRRAATLLGDLGGETSITPLTAALRDSQAPVRLSAIEALERVGGEGAIEVLVAAVHTAKDLPTRLACLDGLLSLRHAPPLPLVVDALRSPVTRRTALRLIAMTDDPAAAAACIDSLSDRSYATRDAALAALNAVRARGLSGVDFERAHEALSRDDFALLRQSLAARDESTVAAAMELAGWLGVSELAVTISRGVFREPTRRSALVALGAIGEAGVEALLAAAKAAPPMDRAAALEALASLDARAALPLGRSLIDDPHPHVANAAAHVLASLGDPADAPALIAHLERAGEGARVARDGLIAMGEAAREATLSAIRTTDLQQKDDLVASLVEIAAGYLDAEDAMPIARDLLASGGSRSRLAAVALVARAGVVALAPALLDRFDAAGPDARVAILGALEGLVRLGPDARASLAKAVALAAQDPSSRVRGVAARAAASLDPDEALGVLSDLAQSDLPAVSVAAIRAVAALDTLPLADRLSVLERACEHLEPDVVRAAARALGAIDSSQGVRSLTQLLSHPRFEVRMAAAHALRKHGNAAIGPLSAQLGVEEDALVRVAIREALATALAASSSPAI